MLAALLILAATVALLSMGRLPRLGARRHRPWVALAGGAAMVAAGILPAELALAAVDVEILALLLGMLALAAALEVAGFFDWLAGRLVARATTQPRLLAEVMLTTAVLSALFLNDAVVLLATPVLVKAARRLAVDPMPYLAGEAIAANLGSVATPVGNPQNAYIAVASGLSFVDFATALVPVAAACLAAGVAITLLVFRRSLAPPLDRAALAALPREGPRDPRLLGCALAVLAAVFAGFLAGGAAGLGLAAVAFLGGAAVLALAAALSLQRAAEVARRVDVGILGFFVGLFWVVAGVREAGLLAAAQAALPGGAGLDVPTLAALAAALSNVVSNVPAVLLLAPAVEAAGGGTLWVALAASSTLAGNATLVGAAANVIVAEAARREGAEFPVGRFMRAGVPVTLATLALAVALLGR